MARSAKHIVGLDIGTTKVCVTVAEPNENGSLDIVGFGTCPSKGLRKGVVINLDATIDSIKSAVEEAELMAGVSVEKAFVGIAGGHVRGFNSRGVVAISGKDHEVTRADIARVLNAARAVSIPPDREIFHVLPQEFIVDDQEGIGDPVGMTGTRLEANVYVVTGSISAVQNIVNCVNRAGIEVEDTVLEQLAASEATLTTDEKEMGVAIIDVGGGTTDLALLERGAIRHISILPTGGDHFTNDIAVGLRTPVPEAERIKKKYGCAVPGLVGEEDTIEVPSVGGRKSRVLSRQILCEIIQPRAEEIFSLINEEIVRTGFDKSINAGAVLTGGGSIMEGIPEIAEDVLDMPVRRAAPVNVGGLSDGVNSPLFATPVGLILFGHRHRTRRVEVQPPTNPFFFVRMGERMKTWIQELF
ncbi:MAG TPA: cell division protein FtsA [Candidatus Polarisedimenticolia bacterium]|jgi:cell division protein FtsA|nr:cell division protein FtsA [Candidatus Polarisedimenticolia bacterium]